MPKETQDAVNWSLSETIINEYGDAYQVTKNTPSLLVNKVREYFNVNGIEYPTFSYDDLLPFL